MQNMLLVFLLFHSLALHICKAASHICCPSLRHVCHIMEAEANTYLISRKCLLPFLTACSPPPCPPHHLLLILFLSDPLLFFSSSGVKTLLFGWRARREVCLCVCTIFDALQNQQKKGEEEEKRKGKIKSKKKRSWRAEWDFRQHFLKR